MKINPNGNWMSVERVGDVHGRGGDHYRVVVALGWHARRRTTEIIDHGVYEWLVGNVRQGVYDNELVVVPGLFGSWLVYPSEEGHTFEDEFMGR